jgi:hypothetical protein
MDGHGWLKSENIGQTTVAQERATYRRRTTSADIAKPPPVDQSAKERRERIATAAMAGMLANPKVADLHGGPLAPDQYADDAISWADALIAALDAPKTESPRHD